MSMLKIMRAKCMDCCGGSSSEVRECEISSCALHPYRMGKNPFRKKRDMTEEQRSELRVRLAAARQENRSEALVSESL